MISMPNSNKSTRWTIQTFEFSASFQQLELIEAAYRNSVQKVLVKPSTFALSLEKIEYERSKHGGSKIGARIEMMELLQGANF